MGVYGDLTRVWRVQVLHSELEVISHLFVVINVLPYSDAAHPGSEFSFFCRLSALHFFTGSGWCNSQSVRYSQNVWGLQLTNPADTSEFVFGDVCPWILFYLLSTVHDPFPSQ